MGKIRDWMHGSGRKTVIAVVTVIAAAIVIHYFVVERHGKWGLESAYSAGVNETGITKATERLLCRRQQYRRS